MCKRSTPSLASTIWTKIPLPTDTEVSLMSGNQLLKNPPKFVKTFTIREIQFSFGKVSTESIKHILKTSSIIDFFFSSLSEWTKIIQNLTIILSSLIETHLNSDQPGCLISECDQFDSIFSRTYFAVDLIPLYAENLGFHLCTSVARWCKYITSFFSSYHKFFVKKRSNFVGGVIFIFSFLLYLFNSKLRCKDNVKTLFESNLKFTKVI